VTRAIGLDHGERRIGVAVGDSETGMAFARPALRTRSLADAVDRIGRLVSEEGAELLIIGLPVTLGGREGSQAARARAFGEALAGIGVEIVFVDERLTSWEAGEQLAESGRSPNRSSGELDSAAARLILRQYFDALPAAPSHDLHPGEETE
jgi:putative Holliday junction resolvase